MRIPHGIPDSIASSVLRIWPGESCPFIDRTLGLELQRRTTCPVRIVPTASINRGSSRPPPINSLRSAVPIDRMTGSTAQQVLSQSQNTTTGRVLRRHARPVIWAGGSQQPQSRRPNRLHGIFPKESKRNTLEIRLSMAACPASARRQSELRFEPQGVHVPAGASLRVPRA